MIINLNLFTNVVHTLLHIIANSRYIVIRDIVAHIKLAISGITESKLSSFVSDQEVNMNVYSVLRSDEDRKGRSVAC